MKLRRAHFKNFRLLRDVNFDFSMDADRRLTVIRAANESGKTTLLHGLQWALYGESALPGRGEDFRLHPIDWDSREGTRVSIVATVDFDVTTHRRTASGTRKTVRQYRLIRSAFEEVDTTSGRTESTVRLFVHDDSGSQPIAAPETLIEEELPPDLREVFFTDGDRALSFIEADVARSTKRQRVERAIRSLLGLGVIESGIRHVRKTAAEVNRKAKQVGTDSDLRRVTSRLEGLEKDHDRLEADSVDAKQQFQAFDEKLDTIDRGISAALKKGDKDKLRQALDKAKRDVRGLDDQMKAANKEHSALFRSKFIAIDLLAPVLRRSLDLLEELHDQGKIPNTTIPVLQDRLAAEVCICGETLDPTDPEGHRRRDHIQKVIDDSERADELQKTITDLYYGTRPLQGGATGASGSWLDDYRRVVQRRDGLQDLRDEAGRRLRGLERQLAALPDTDIQGLRNTQRDYKEERDRHLSRKSIVETQLINLRGEREQLEKERHRLLRAQKQGTQILAELEVIQDVLMVLESAYQRITSEELQKVSDLMNTMFLEMIGADPEQGAIIKQAKISPEFDIVVYGPNKRTLNPDRDLNGASRRALTLAFILALSKVSEVEAPNVIDTPLGMTSGFVKRSVLRTAVRESAQLILFLTHDEIAGCEEIIDDAAGVVFTLTNPAHYPMILVNDPGVKERKILRCGCDHRGECRLCQRYADAQVEPDVVL